MTAQIKDNGDAGYADTGWPTDTFGSHIGPNYAYIIISGGSNPGAKSSYTFTVTPGVRVWLGLHGGGTVSPHDTPVNVYDSDGTTVLATGVVDQQAAFDFTDTVIGSTWYLVASVVPTGSTVKIEITGGGTPLGGLTIVPSDGAWCDTVNPLPETKFTVKAGDASDGAMFDDGLALTAPATLRMKHNMTISDNRSVGDGTAGLAINSPNPGICLTLETGTELLCRGSMVFSNDIVDSPAPYLCLDNSGEIVFDCDAGYTPYFFPAKGTKVRMIGTPTGFPLYPKTTAELKTYISSNFATIRTKSLAAGDDADSLGGAVQFSRWFPLEADYWCFYKTGNFTVYGTMTNGFNCQAIPLLKTGASQTYFNDNVSDENGTFNRIGSDGALDFIFGFDNEIGNQMPDGADWQCNRNSFRSGLVVIHYAEGCEVKNNYFFGNLFMDDFADGTKARLVKDNFIYASRVGEDGSVTFPWDGNYILVNQYSTDGGGSGGSAYSYGSEAENSMINCIWEVSGGLPTMRVIRATEGTPRSRHYVTTGNLLIPAEAIDIPGATACLSLLLSTRVSESYMGVGADTDATITFENNTCWTGRNTGFDHAALELYGLVAEGVGVAMVESCRNNICWQNGVGAGSRSYIIYNRESVGAPVDPALDSAPAANIDYNGKVNLDVVAPGHWSSEPGDTDVEADTPYNSPMSGPTAPGVHDFSADPQFVDKTVGIAAWAVHKGCSSGASYDDKLAFALNILAHDIYAIRDDLSPWIRSKFSPTNEVYRNAGYLGVTPGAVEFGTPGPPTVHRHFGRRF